MFPTTSASIYTKLHFLQFERSDDKQKEGVIKYVIKNHFNSPVVKVEGKKSYTDDKLELNVVNLLAPKEIISSNVLFRITVPIHNSDDASDYKECTLLSASGETLGRVVNVKDVGLSTCSYNVIDRANQLLFQVYRNVISEGYCELHIKPPSKEIAIARIAIEKSSISLSMAPELDADSKMRLICFMIYKELTEKTNTPVTTVGIQPMYAVEAK